MRVAFDASKDLARTGPPEQHPPLPCLWCGVLTARVTLATYGARCFDCYRAYLVEPQPPLKWSGDKRDDPRGWAQALKKRDDAGENLTIAQRDMYRAALRREGAGAEAGA